MRRFILLAAIAYGIWPLDVIPDVAPGVGWVDDGIVIGAAIVNLLRSSKKSK